MVRVDNQRHRCALVALAATLAVVAWAPCVRAWGYVEHLKLGSEAYASVCRELVDSVAYLEDKQADGKLTPTEQQLLLTPEERTRLNLACGPLGINSGQYGQYVALAGDHLGVDNIHGISANIAAKNFLEYLLRANHNADHFHPTAPGEWRKYHEQAIQKAAEAHRAVSYAELVDLFWIALATNAYADHFLQDSFSAGHSGFNRASSTPSASYQLHKRLNDNGKLFRDGAGREWRGFGDDNLERADGSEGERRVERAAEASVRDFLLVFVMQRRSKATQVEVASRIPVFTNDVCGHNVAALDSERFAPFNELLDKRSRRGWQVERSWLFGRPVDADLPTDAAIAKAITEHEPRTVRCSTDGRDWNSLLLIQEPARYAVTHTVGATHLGRINQLESVVAPTYSFGLYAKGLRLGFDLGYYVSTRSRGDSGALIAPNASIPLGGSYGSVLSWDVDLKLMVLLPATTGSDSSVTQHLAQTLGLGVMVQLGIVNLRLSGGPALVLSNQVGLGEDRWNTAGLGWYGQLGINFTFSPGGGGPMRPWAF